MMTHQIAGRSAFSRFGLFVALYLLLAGCAADLTRAYDASLFSGLNVANQETLVLFSEISAGVGIGHFADLQPKYDSLIGKFEALKMQSAVRPIPALGLRLGSRMPGCGSAGECLDSSNVALGEIVANFQGLKEDNRKLGLTPAAVQISKGDYLLAIKQVLVIENALGG